VFAKPERETWVQVNEQGASQWEDLMPTLLTNIVTPEESPAGPPPPFGPGFVISFGRDFVIFV